MLGRLLQTAATTFGREGGQQRAKTGQSDFQLESVTEEAHTRDLLYPDFAALRISQHSALPFHTGRVPATPREAANHDDRGGLAVSHPSDVRVLIAQDANAKNPAQILFDSRPLHSSQPTAATAAAQEQQLPLPSQRLHARGKSHTSPQKSTSATGNIHQQKASVTSFYGSGAGPTSPLSPDSKRGTLASSYYPRPSISDSLYAQEIESMQSRLAREKEEAEAIINCMFGSPGMRLESGTKLHVLPRNFSNAERGTSIRSRAFSPGGSGLGPKPSMQRSSTSLESSRSSPHSSPSQASAKVSVMITKLFHVHLLETTIAEPDNQGDNKSVDDTIRPGTESERAGNTSPSIKQRKTPMYAVSIIINLPHDPFPRVRSNPSPSAGYNSNHFNHSAPNSPRPLVHIPSFGPSDGRAPAPASIDPGPSNQITFILMHWSLISRNIRLLELSAQARLAHMLDHIVPLAPVPVPSQGKAGNLKLRRPKLPSQQAVYVSADALQDDLQIRKQADQTSYNIAHGLRAKRVVPGQGRWGAWREEARWVSRWAGNKAQNYFFYTFISAFLGQHPAWIEHVAPRWYASRAKRQRMYGSDDTDLLPHRTVIICKDKMAARRLVFLAASFMPTPFKTNPPAFMRPLLDQGAAGESPPMLSTTPRDYGKGPSILRRDSPNTQAPEGTGHARSVSFSVLKTNDEPSEEDRLHFGEQLARRASEAGSIRSTFTSLPTATNESNKASTSTLLADSALPVAHFSTRPSNSPRDMRDSQDPRTARPGSNGSIASFALNSALRRSESSVGGSTSSLGGRFGSMMSGFWSTAPESSTDGSTTDDPPGTSNAENTAPARSTPLLRGHSTSGTKSAIKLPTRLEDMVEESSYISRASPAKISATSVQPPMSRSLGSAQPPLDIDFCLKKSTSNTETNIASRMATVEAEGEPERMPLTLSMNDEDGFVDVAMPQGMSINSSLTSSFASLRMGSFGYSLPYGSGNTTANSSADVSEHLSPYGSPSLAGGAAPRTEASPNVAGWLKEFHPDFVVQAVQPYVGLDRDIQQALEAEARLATPADYDAEDESLDWRSVCSILVADASSFTVERRTLQRRRRQYNPEQDTRSDGDEQFDQAPPPFFLSPSSSTVSLLDLEVEERIITEPLLDMDPIFIEAVERVLARSESSSRIVSRAASRAPSPSRSRPVSVKSSTVQNSPQSSSATKQSQLQPQERAASDAGFAARGSAPGSRNLAQVPFPECRRIIMGGLEEVVKSVIEERELGHAHTSSSKRAAGARTAGAGSDSLLREGVGEWLNKVETDSKNLNSQFHGALQ